MIALIALAATGRDVWVDWMLATTWAVVAIFFAVLGTRSRRSPNDFPLPVRFCAATALLGVGMAFSYLASALAPDLDAVQWAGLGLAGAGGVWSLVEMRRIERAGSAPESRQGR